MHVLRNLQSQMLPLHELAASPLGPGQGKGHERCEQRDFFLLAAVLAVCLSPSPQQIEWPVHARLCLWYNSH